MPPLVNISEGAMSPSSLFAQNTGLLFEVRPPQRRFKWKSQHVDQLWEDIVSAYKEERDSYYLGTLLLQRLGKGRVSVIDGQQRIAVLSILLAVLRDQCKKYGEDYRAGKIQELISRVDDDGEPTGELVVKLQEPDNEVFVRLVKGYGSTTEAASRKGLLPDAVRGLSSLVANFINVPNRVPRLKDLCSYVQHRVKLLALEIRSEEEGYLVFDVTNTRGLQLTRSEALKARLATVARQDKELSEDLIGKWDGTATKLEIAKLPINAMDDYLHVILCWRPGYTTKRSLDRIASSLTDSDELRRFVRCFVEDLDSYCDSYLSVVAPSGKSSLSEDLRDLRSLNLQSHGFLTMVHKHSSSRFEEALSLVLSLQIRNITVGPFQANRYEKDWPKWARLARDGNAEEAFGEIRHHLVSDEDFQRSFEGAVINKTETARHLLRRLDPISHSRSGVQPLDVDVEHIMPKSLVTKLVDDKRLTPNVRQWIQDLGHSIPETSDEKQQLGDEFEPYLFRLGNQTLLNDRENRGAKDLPFSEKRVFYGGQALELTKDLSEYAKWGISEISNRQKELARRAPAVWPK